MGKKNIANQMRARAREVRHDGSYGGLFEIAVWCYMRKVHILLAFGVTILNVYTFFGTSLPQFTPKKKFNLVAAQVINGKNMSADMPGVIVPVVNHFLIGRSEHAREGLETSVGATAAMYLPGGGRRTAAAVAKDFAWRLEASACQDDCLIDCFSYFSQKPRNPIAWKEIREEIAMEMDSIAASIEISGNLEWEACFKLCGEDAVGQSLMSGPYDPDAAPEFSRPCLTGGYGR